MKKSFFLLLIFLYLFMVALRIAGQVYNGSAIDWKSTLTLGELDNTQDYGDRWKIRIAVMLALPFLWLNGLGKQIAKLF